MKNDKPEEFVPTDRRALMLKDMQRVSDAVYSRAITIGNHAFIEFVGLMNEYIKMCAESQKQGIDFTNTNVHSGHALPMATFNASYIGEKLGCIFGPSLQHPENRVAFLAAAGLAPTK